MMPDDFWHKYGYADITRRTHYFYKERNLQSQLEWNKTRTLAYWIVQVNSSKPIKETDIMRFPWDNEVKVEKPKIDKEQLKRITDMFNNKKVI